MCLSRFDVSLCVSESACLCLVMCACLSVGVCLVSMCLGVCRCGGD
jgi:hypothetical protein